MIVIWVALLKDTDVAFAAWNVDTFSRGIEIDLVGILNTGQRDNLATRIRVKDRKAGRFMRGHKEAVMLFVEGHREIVLQGHRPARNGARFTIDDADLL